MSDSSIDFIEADFGEQNAAGGAYHLNNSTPEFWDKWANKGVRSPIWPFFFLLMCSLALASLPIVAEIFMPRNLEQPAAQPVATEAPQQTPVQAQQTGFGLGFGQPQAQAPTQEEPQTTYASGSYANSPGYDSRFGRPVR